MKLFPTLLVTATLLSINANAPAAPATMTVYPRPLEGALRNPLMGFRVDLSSDMASHPWVTLARHYIKWNEIENDESDGIDKIRDFCNQKWRNAEKQNIKIIPRVYLRWAGENETYWPADLTSGDYSSPRFMARLQRLIGRLGQVWDSDPRVAFVQMGLIGKWGEHHTPELSPAMQKFLGDAFVQAFPHKKVMVRHPWDFAGYRFGIYWDSWAHFDQMSTHGQGIFQLGDRWKTQVMGGETAYDWGNYKTQPGLNPTATVSQAVHRSFLINTIRRLHANHLGWVADYNRNDANASAGAEQVQKAFGYRFVITQATLPRQLRAGRDFSVSLLIRNDGSTPLYADWPLEFSLLHTKTRRVIWQSTLSDVRTSQWLPGDDWNEAARRYRITPNNYTVRGSFRLPRGVKQDEYFLAISLLDPAGNLPSARFAIANYFTGGRQPLARVGVGVAARDAALQKQTFDDPNADRTLHYSVGKSSP